MNNAKIEAIIKRSASNFTHLVTAHEDELIDCLQDLEDGETLTISHSIKIDIEKDSITNKISFSRKYQDESKEKIPNPDQLEMEGME